MKIRPVGKVDDLVTIRNALISVADKEGLDALLGGLAASTRDLTIFSTGGTFAVIRETLARESLDSIRLREVSEYTGQPEMEGGLVKTLDYKIYMGLLSETYNEAHAADLKRCGAVPIDLVVANLYPFERTVASSESTVEEARGNIDIGGPCMIRAAAKNFLRVAVVCDPGDYSHMARLIASNRGATTLSERFELARKAFEHTKRYDEKISSWLGTVDIPSVLGRYGVGGKK